MLPEDLPRCAFGCVAHDAGRALRVLGCRLVPSDVASLARSRHSVFPSAPEAFGSIWLIYVRRLWFVFGKVAC